jgi:hypothetical protein
VGGSGGWGGGGREREREEREREEREREVCRLMSGFKSLSRAAVVWYIWIFMNETPLLLMVICS